MCLSRTNRRARARLTGNHGGVYLVLLALLAASCGDVDVYATSRATSANRYTDGFDALDLGVWRCEYSCPSVSAGTATFSLLPGVQPNNAGSWSKIRYTPRRFTSGAFTVRFALGPRPTESVWWGVALWDPGPSPDESQYNEINFGYTTDATSTNTQMDFLSARLGQKTSLKIDTGTNLYDGSYHVGRLVYDRAHVDLYLDGALLQTITDTRFIPTDPLDLVLGARLVTAPVLTSRFDAMVDSCEIEW
jgi:hypothetical protein